MKHRFLVVMGCLLVACLDDTSVADPGDVGSTNSPAPEASSTSGVEETSESSGSSEGGPSESDDSSSGTGAVASCGDGMLDVGEECDEGDGNGPGRACLSDCTSNVCGDSDVGPTEACDDGNDVDDDACTSLCRAPECGDGLFAPSLGEECDDGNFFDFDECPNDCTLAVCGDAAHEGPEGCDHGVENGNGFSECTAACVLNTCGDGYLFLQGEDCEPGQPIEEDCSYVLGEDGVGPLACTLSCDYDTSGCLSACDPLLQDCAGFLDACGPASGAFYCLQGGAGGDGDACTTQLDCGIALVCRPATDLDGCADESCCTWFCDVDFGGCTGAQQCIPYFPPGEAPPEYDAVGYCGVP